MAFIKNLAQDIPGSPFWIAKKLDKSDKPKLQPSFVTSGSAPAPTSMINSRSVY